MSNPTDVRYRVHVKRLEDPMTGIDSFNIRVDRPTMWQLVTALSFLRAHVDNQGASDLAYSALAATIERMAYAAERDEEVGHTILDDGSIQEENPSD